MGLKNMQIDIFFLSLLFFFWFHRLMILIKKKFGFMVFFKKTFIRLSQSHDLSHGFCGITRVGLPFIT